MRGIGAALGFVGTTLFIVGLCWLRYVALAFMDFLYSGICLAVGMAVAGLGGWIYQKAKTRRHGGAPESGQ
jgi:FtsH-binding integral membrane protein